MDVGCRFHLYWGYYMPLNEQCVMYGMQKPIYLESKAMW